MFLQVFDITWLSKMGDSPTRTTWWFQHVWFQHVSTLESTLVSWDYLPNSKVEFYLKNIWNQPNKHWEFFGVKEVDPGGAPGSISYWGMCMVKQWRHNWTKKHEAFIQKAGMKFAPYSCNNDTQTILSGLLIIFARWPLKQGNFQKTAQDPT